MEVESFSPYPQASAKGLGKQNCQPKIVGVPNDIQVGYLPYKNPKL
jgi:hypothetical protein